MNRLWGHLKAIVAHKLAVTKLCFRCGLHKQELLHDLSKYTPVEFCVDVKYFQGNRDPIDYEEGVEGHSLGWLHHKGRNKHHWKYWSDNTVGGIRPMKMPLRHIVEMYCNRAVALHIYMKENYHGGSTYEYPTSSYGSVIMHEEIKAMLKMTPGYQRDYGTDATVDFTRKEILKN